MVKHKIGLYDAIQPRSNSGKAMVATASSKRAIASSTWYKSLTAADHNWYQARAAVRELLRGKGASALAAAKTAPNVSAKTFGTMPKGMPNPGGAFPGMDFPASKQTAAQNKAATNTPAAASPATQAKKRGRKSYVKNAMVQKALQKAAANGVHMPANGKMTKKQAQMRIAASKVGNGGVPGGWKNGERTTKIGKQTAGSMAGFLEAGLINAVVADQPSKRGKKHTGLMKRSANGGYNTKGTELAGFTTKGSEKIVPFLAAMRKTAAEEGITKRISGKTAKKLDKAGFGSQLKTETFTFKHPKTGNTMTGTRHSIAPQSNGQYGKFRHAAGPAAATRAVKIRAKSQMGKNPVRAHAAKKRNNPTGGFGPSGVEIS